MKKTGIIIIFGFFVLILGACTTVEPWCGTGSAPSYGFTNDKEQDHWTRNWERYLKSSTVEEVDAVLDGLYNDNILETVVFFMPAGEVTQRVNCAVHYLRYMEMGRSNGPRRDNGYSLIFVVEPDKSLDVHYGVGLGLPSMTAPHLSELNRIGERAYEESGSYDEAVLEVVYGLNEYARRHYDPISDSAYEAMISPYERQNQEAAPETEGSGGSSVWFWIIVFILLIVVYVALGGNTSGSYGGPTRTSPSSDTYRSPSGPSRGGRGGGRSGRGN